MDSDIPDGIPDGQDEDIQQVVVRGLRDDQGARVYPRKLCNPTYKTRLSTMRFIKTARKFSEIQKGHVRKYKMEALLHMPYHLSIPMNLLEWLDQHICGSIPRFKHKDKVIEITKDMVDKIFGFPSGIVPFVFSSNDPQVKAEVAQLRSKYTDYRNKIPINKIEEVMLADESEEGFIRSFAFYFIASIMCPASYCYASSKYLFSLLDVSAIPTLDFGRLGLECMLEESERHCEMIFNRETLEEMNKPSHIGGCLPIWGGNNNIEVPSLNTVINLSSNQNNSEEAKYTPKDEDDVKVKTENHLESQTKVQINYVLETPKVPINPANINRIPIPREDTSQPKVQVNSSSEPRSFVLISSTPAPDREKVFHASPIIIEDETPFTPVAPDIDPNVGIHIAMSFADIPDSSRFNDAGAGTSTGPNTIDKKNRKKRAAKT